ncbi:aminotransferase class I/II-fold pyridoxal phosphate-dependent enzyme [Halomicrococcus sp. NG-SE-24]|uniref:aminotransferase class I/II-fold pyridoxal phosphate-dependent enzyme n=1 Tax=Halomicrococcus sp. NG-SE-24 TaxID=3436928 RepID=UPI003D989409
MPDERTERRRGFDLAARLRTRERRGLHRDLRPVESVEPRTRAAPDPGGGVPAFDAEGSDDLRVFAANDYLGLAGDDRLADAAADAAADVGVGAGASRLVSGDTVAHRRLERALADAKGAERALAFSSGYATNVGTIAALDPDVVFSDELNHASIVDGCRLSGGDVEIYDHCDGDALRAAMARRARDSATDESWLVVTDSVFSMDGDVAPLDDVCAAAERHGAWVMVDEAHATGVYPGGVVGERGLGDRVQVQLGTLSKALGAQGGFVAGSETLVEHLVNAARSFVFSTGLAPPAAAAAREGLRIARETDRRDRLHRNAAYLRDGLTERGFEVLGETHVLPVLVGDRADAVALAGALRSRGVLAPAIRPPTVPADACRIRVAPTATHDEAALDACLDAFESAGREVGLP